MTAAHNGHAFPAKVWLAKHHFAGVKTLSILFGHAVRQFDFLANAHADMFSVKHLILGGDNILPLLAIKLHALNVLVENQRIQPRGSPVEIIGKLST
ncbi:hypothetical protein D3C80_1788380 [compost metagenome]